MTQNERKWFGVIGFLVVALIGVLHHFFGQVIIGFVLTILEIVLHWFIGATIILVLIAMLGMIFLNEKQIDWLCDDSKRTARERKEQEVIEEYFKGKNAQNSELESNEE